MKFKDSGKCFNAVKISVDLLVPDPDQPRTESGLDEESLAVLGNMMMLEGQLHPVVVRRHDEEKWMIVSGERRCRAAKLVGLETVDCVQIVIDQKKSAEEQRLDIMFAAMAGNFSTPLSNSELSAYFTKMANLGCSTKTIAERTGFKESFVRSLVALEKAPEELKAAVGKKRMSKTAAVEAARAPAETRDSIIEKSHTGKIRVADVQVAVKGRANMIPATKIDKLISVCVRNCKKTNGAESEQWDCIAMFLRNHVLGDLELEEVSNGI